MFKQVESAGLPKFGLPHPLPKTGAELKAWKLQVVQGLNVLGLHSQAVYFARACSQKRQYSTVLAVLAEVVTPVVEQDPVTVVGKLRAGWYQSKLPYPDLLPASHPNHASLDAAREQAQEYRRDVSRLTQLFREEAERELWLHKLPEVVRTKVWDLAYQDGHASGLESVYHYLSDYGGLALLAYDEGHEVGYSDGIDSAMGYQ